MIGVTLSSLLLDTKDIVLENMVFEHETIPH